MNNFTNSSKFIWLFAIIGTLAVVVILITAFIVPKKTSAPQQQGNTQAGDEASKFTPKITQVPTEKLPEKFPVDLPLEASAKVVDNYNATSNNGNVQATREYESSKTPAQNFTIYSNYFNGKGWEVLTSSNTASSRSLTVRKGNTIIQALFYENTVSKASVVRVNVTVLGDSATTNTQSNGSTKAK